MTEKTLLLVDDEEDIRDILYIPLTDMGYTVYTAENGEAALEIFRSKKPPIVITDIKMPGMDGIELLEMIKNEDPDVEVIMITGHGDMNLAIQSFRDDAVDFITKPINVTALQTAIHRANEKILIKQKLKAYTEGLEAHLFEKIRLLEKAEQEFKETRAITDFTTDNERLENLFNKLPCYISLVDRDFRLTSVNKMFVEAFGGKPGDHCYRILKQQNQPCRGCTIQRTFSDGMSYQSQMTYTDLSDQPVNVLAWTSAVRDESGDISQVMIMSTDTAQIDELQDNLSSLGLKVGSISHGIKGLLTGLEGGVYILDSGFSKDDKKQIKEGYDVVKQMVGRIKNLVLDLLLYSKDVDIKTEPTDVVKFAGDVAQVVGSKAEEHAIQLIKSFDPSLSTIEIDPGMLSTALINVLENAVDACVEDNTKDSHTIEFTVKPANRHILFAVQDDGIGMDRETRENVFTLFFSSKGKKGTGLGLFITKKIVQQHDGTCLPFEQGLCLALEAGVERQPKAASMGGAVQ